LLRERNALQRKQTDMDERVAREGFEAEQTYSELSLQQRARDLRRKGQMEQAFALEREAIGADADDRIRRASESFIAMMPSMTEEEALGLARIKVSAEVAEEQVQHENMVAEHRRNIESAQASNRLDLQLRSNQLDIEQRARALEEQGKIVEANELRFANVRFAEQDKINRRVADLIRSGYDEQIAIELATSQVQIEIQEDLAQAEQNLKQANLQESLALRALNWQEEQTLAQVALDNQVRLFEMRNDRVGMLQAQLALIGVDVDKRIQENREALIAQGISNEEDLARAAALVRLEIAQERADKEMEIDRAKLANLRQITDSSIDLAKNAGQAIFGENKALAVSGAIMDTYSGATAALGSRPWTPINYVHAAAVIASGIANVRKILAIKKEATGSVSSTAPQAPNVGTSFGLVNTGTNMNAMMTASEMGSGQFSQAPTFIFEGDLNPEMMAIKVRQGNNSIAGRTVSLQ
jgi:hypothetical protein